MKSKCFDCYSDDVYYYDRDNPEICLCLRCGEKYLSIFTSDRSLRAIKLDEGNSE